MRKNKLNNVAKRNEGGHFKSWVWSYYTARKEIFSRFTDLTHTVDMEVLIQAGLTWISEREPGSFLITGTVQTAGMETVQMTVEATRIMKITVKVEMQQGIPGRNRTGRWIMINGRAVQRSGDMSRQVQETIMSLIMAA